MLPRWVNVGEFFILSFLISSADEGSGDVRMLGAGKRNVRNIHLLECMALCQKYCQLSLKKMAMPKRAAGSRTQ